MTALPETTGVVARLHDVVTRDTDDHTPPLRAGLFITVNEGAELLDLIGRLCGDSGGGHLVCQACGGHQCPTCQIDGAPGPWCTEHGLEPLCGECSSECPRCRSLAAQERSGL